MLVVLGLLAAAAQAEPKPSAREVLVQKLTDSRVSAIRELERLSKLAPRSVRSEILHKLGELCGEQAVEMERLALASTPESDAFADREVSAYQEVLINDPAYPRADEVLFGLGNALMGRDRHGEALVLWQDFVLRYPTFSNMAEAYSALGDCYATANDPLKSLLAYQRALALTPTEQKANCTYKIAWSWWSLGEKSKAIEAMHTALGAPDLVPREQALIELVDFYQKAELVEAGAAYFSSINRPDLSGRVRESVKSTPSHQGSAPLDPQPAANPWNPTP